jgi:hypothetical protein
MTAKEMSLVQVKVKSFIELQKLRFPLALDNYQRPYVWDDVKVRQLIDDLLEHQTQGTSVPNYYMGTLLLHKNAEKEKYFVIDGQQRLTSLSILYYVLKNGQLPENINFTYRSPVSVDNIQKAKALFDKYAKNVLRNELFSRLNFTAIKVDREDLAFTFFDTQNNRGVALKSTDLLKAFHLRAIHSEEAKKDEQIQELCAKRWEHVQVKGEKGEKNRDNDFAPELFHYYLWRARNWKGKNIKRESHDDVIATFQAGSVGTPHVTNVPLYPGTSNTFAGNLELLGNDDYRLLPQALDISRHAAKLPFSMRQPVHQGVGFFLYAQKYASLINLLFDDENPEPEVKAFNRFYSSVISHLSLYLRELFKLSALMYVDQFGWNQLLRFSLHLDHVFGAIRLDKKYIFKEAPLKFLKEPSQNFLDVIAGAYRPEEVMDYIKADQWASNVYQSEKTVGIKRKEGVQGRYLDAVLEYYNKNDFSDKHEWMDAHIKVGK